MNGVAAAFSEAAARRGGGGSAAWALDLRGRWIGVALTWVLMLLMTVPDNFDYSSLSSTTPPVSGSAMSRLLWLGLLIAPMMVIAWRLALSWLLLRWVNAGLLAFCSLVLISAVWSDDPGITVRRFMRVAAVLLCALSFAVLGWDARRFQRVLLPPLTVLLAGSLLFGLLRPQLAIHQETSHELLHAWRGLANNKNSLGDLASMGVVLWLHAWLSAETARWKAVIGVAIAGACLLLSRSSTSLMVTVAVSALLLLLCRAPRHWRPALPPLIVTGLLLTVCYSLVVVHIVPGLDILLKPLTVITGKDLSFTGRTEIWAAVVEHARQHLWLGTGYGAYWVGPLPGTPVYRVVESLHFYPGSAHSGYLEALNDLGMVGLACLLAFMALFLRHALRLMRLDHTQGALMVALFAQQVMGNLSETHWFSVMSSDYVIMSYAALCTARQLLDRRLREVFGEPRLVVPPQAPHQPHPWPAAVAP
jgi:O-antigen ligase